MRTVLGTVSTKPRQNRAELLPTATAVDQSSDLVEVWDRSERKFVSVSPAQLAGSLGLVFLNSVTATGSTVSSGSFASVASGYIGIKADAVGLRLATTGEIAIRTSSDGTNYSATTAAYQFALTGLTATMGGTASGRSATADSAITTMLVGSLVATDAGSTFSGEITLHNLNATATLAFPHVLFQVNWDRTGIDVISQGGGRRNEAIAQGGLQLAALNAGSFIDGRVDFFGIKGA